MTLTSEELLEIIGLARAGRTPQEIASTMDLSVSLIREILSMPIVQDATACESISDGSELIRRICTQVYDDLDEQSFQPPLTEKYRVGEIASRVGVTKEMVRKYENKGIVKSERDPVNGYRCYDCNDLWELNKLRSYRAMGFSLEEAQTLLVCNDIGYMTEAFRDRITELKTNIDELTNTLRMVRDVDGVFKRLRDGLGCCCVEMSPSYLWLRHVQPTSGDKEALRVMSIWTNHMPLVRIGARYTAVGHCIKVEHGYYVLADAARSVNLPVCDAVIELKSRMSIHSVVSHKVNMITGFFRNNIFEPLFSYTKENNLAVENRIIGVGIVALGGAADRAFYQDVWMPLIENND